MNPEPTKHFRSLPFLIVTFIILFGFSVWYYLYQLPLQQYGDRDEEVFTATSTVETADWKTYKDNNYGFAFYYPNSWVLNDGADGILLNNFGPDKTDRITVRRVEGNKVEVQDAKFGNTTLYFDEFGAKQWMETAPTRDEDNVTSPANPSFYTISGLPVFTSTGRWETYIIPLSHVKFLVVNITGSGWTSALKPFVQSFVESNSVISNEAIEGIIHAEIKSESN